MGARNFLAAFVCSVSFSSSLGFAGVCVWYGAYLLVRCLNTLCDVDLVLLRIFFVDSQSGLMLKLGVQSVSTIFCV